MDELDVVRGFRAGVTAPGGLERARALARLEMVIGPAPPPRPRMPRRRFALVVATAVALAVAAALLPGRLGGGHGTGVLDRALAAVSTGPVLHVVLEVPVEQRWLAPGPVHVTVVDLTTNAERPVIARTELWYDPAGHRVHQQETVGGGLLWDLLETPAGSRDNLGRGDLAAGAPQIDPALGAFFEGYKRALADGSATATSGTVDGRAVQWLHFPGSGSGVAEEIAVDARTYQPLLLRAVCPECTRPPVTYRIVALEGVADAAANWTAPTPEEEHAVASFDSAAERTTVASISNELGGSALWAGRSVAGLDLSAVQLVHASTHSAVPPTPANRIASGLGATFVYGSAGGTSYAIIAESRTGGFRFSGFNFDVAGGTVRAFGGAPVPPEGQAVVSSTQSDHWTVQLREGGFYVELDSPSRDTALAVARALEPVSSAA